MGGAGDNDGKRQARREAGLTTGASLKQPQAKKQKEGRRAPDLLSHSRREATQNKWRMKCKKQKANAKARDISNDSRQSVQVQPGLRTSSSVGPCPPLTFGPHHLAAALAVHKGSVEGVSQNWGVPLH